MYKDRYGLAVTTASFEAAQKYFKAMDSHLAGNAFSEKWYYEATLFDPNFALANIAHAANLYGEGQLIEGQIYKNKALGSLPSLTIREKQHVMIMKLLMEGNSEKALLAIISHVKSYPLDALMVSAAVGGFGLFSFSGEKENNIHRLQFMDTLKNAYGADWWFLSLHAFSLVEVFKIKEARIKAEQSLQLFERNGHAAHTFTHVCYESGAIKECIDFTSNWVKGYEREAHLYGHIHWHWALSELLLGNFETTKSIYTNHLQPSVSKGDKMGTIADAVSLEWRSFLQGEQLLDDENRKHLSKYVVENRNVNGVLFGEAHLGVLYAHHNIDSHFDELFNDLQNRNAQNAHPKYEMMLYLLKGMKAFAEKDYLRAITIFDSNISEFARLGGSNAQRELVKDTLIKAYLETGNHAAIEGLAHEKKNRINQ